MKKPGGDKKRGRHKKHVSKETIHWEREHLIPPRPEWMDEATYARLARLRNNV